MEVYKFHLTNETKLPKDVIVEPFHFVEELEPNDILEIHFSPASILNNNPFNIITKEHTFVIWIDWNINEPINHSITFLVNNVETFKYEF